MDSKTENLLDSPTQHEVVKEIDFNRNASGIREIKIRHYSQESIDSSELDDCESCLSTPDLQSKSFEQKLNILNGGRLRRTLSESSHEPRKVRGILKYPKGWTRLRTLSESNCDDDYHFILNIAKSIDSIELSDGDEGSECEQSSTRPKKSVHFNNSVSQNFFRRNWTIQKCQKLNKEQTDTGELRDEANNKPAESKRTRARQDSGYDSEGIIPRDTKQQNKRHKKRKNHGKKSNQKQ